MFDWFKEIGEELSGIDSDAIKMERLKKEEQKKLNCFIFSNRLKTLIIILGIIYLVMAMSTVRLLKEQAGCIFYIIKYIIMCITDMVIMFSLIVGKKRGEIIALVGIFIFVVGLVFSTILI